MSDIGVELTNSLDRNGRGGMLAPFKFADGTLVAPGITWNSEPTSGIFRAAANDMQAVIAGVPRMRWTASSVEVWDTGLSAWLPIVGPSGSTYALVGSPNTFTAANTFAAQTIFTKSGIGPSAVNIESGSPWLHWRETDQVAGAQDWLVGNSGGTFLIYASADGSALDKAVLNVTRGVGTSVASITFGNATDNPTFSVLGTGAVAFGGPISAASTITAQGEIQAAISLKSITGAGGAAYVGALVSGVEHIYMVANNSAAPVFGMPAGAYGLTTAAGSQITFAVAGLAAMNVNSAVVTMAGLVRSGDGAVGTPTYSFYNDPALGMWRDSAGSIAFATGGATAVIIRSQGLIVTGSGGVYNKDGTAAAPSYTFLSAQTSGMYLVGTGLGFATSGSLRFRILDSVISTFVPLDVQSTLAVAGVSNLNNAVNTGILTATVADGAVAAEFKAVTGKLRFYGYSGGSCYIQAFDAAASAFIPLDIGASATTFSQGGVSAPSFTTISARDKKRETGTPRKASSILARLRPLLYRMLAGDDKEQLGLIAEEVHEVCPQLSDGKSVAYDRLAILLLAAWQEERSAM
jgi:hypothetical protein